MTTPYFSIIIPCLNEEHFLPHLLDNLNSQTFTDFEVLVVDGNSDDKTAKIASDFRARYPLHFHSTTTRNVAFQRNLGAKMATGKILIFFDADTQIPKNYFKKIAKAFEEKHPHFLTTYIKVDSHKSSEKMFALFSNLVFEAGKVFKTPFSFGAMQAVKKGAFFDVGGYDEATKFGEDSQLFQNLYDYNYKLLVLPSPCYTFSLRRFRSEGILKSFTQSLQLNFNILLNGYHIPPSVRYEMGGGHYDPGKIKDTKYPQIFEPLLSKLVKSSKTQNRRIQTVLDRLFSSK